MKLHQIRVAVSSAGTPQSIWPGVAEVFTVDFTGLTGADVKGKRFLFHDGHLPCYAWGDDGVEPDPSPDGGRSRAFPFSVSDGDDAATIAASLASAIDADDKFSASSSGATATITNVHKGARDDIDPGDMGAQVNVTQQGVNDSELARHIRITARKNPTTANTGDVYIGVSQNGGDNHIVLADKETFEISGDRKDLIDLNELHVDAANNDDAVNVMYF